MNGAWCFFVIGCCQLLGALCAEWSAFMPQTIEALAGSCVLIPCQFEVPENEVARLKKPANGVWRKRSQWFTGGVDVYNSSHHQNILQGEITGDLIQKNCTTILDAIPSNYTDVYYFRIETGFMATFAKSVNIKVIASPPKPQVTSVGAVMEGTPVNLTCTASAPCPRLPPALTWSPPELGRGASALLGNPDGTRSASSTLSFVASRLHRGRIACSADYPLQLGGGSERAEEAVTLNVLYSPKGTSATVSPSELVPEGTTVSLNCTSDANPQVAHYSWFRVKDGKVTAVGWERNLTLVMTENHTGLYHCEAQNEHGRQNSTAVQLRVQGAGAALWIWGTMGGGFLLLSSLLILCICRQRKLPDPVVMKVQGEDDSPVYENISTVTKLGFAENQPRKDLDEAVYSNRRTLNPSGTVCMSNPSGTAERDDQLSANCFTPSRP
ncbi:myelin-associated glycoprotein-like [Anguilla rostrata]|uniref:myelin-associated glycoprotein-like n=1 Tax=Anguilla rostrata TaxID=7938 RepID=UPI0030D4AEDC